MLYKLTHILDEAAKEVPELLWSPAAVRGMKSVVEKFPEVRARTIGPVRLGVFGLELRLAAGAEQVDLTFPILGEDRDVIVNLGRDATEGAWLREEPLWSRIWQLCCRWADPQTLLGQHVKLLWLELDVTGQTGEGALPAPGIFVRFEPETTASASDETWRQILSDVLSLLGGQEPRPELQERFERCRRALPPGAFVQYVGLMLARGSDTVRFVFAGLSEPHLPGFLAGAGWPGPSGDLLDVLDGVTRSGGETLHPGADALQLDFGPSGALPRIGLEYVFDRSCQVEEGIRERRFLEHLVERGLCSPEKLAALLKLPGRDLAVWKDLCLIGHSRQVHHVKLVVGPDGVSEAKAYYGRSLTIQRLESADGAGAASVS
jgi:hypothetical protein